jgi:hypothetical protein
MFLKFIRLNLIIFLKYKTDRFYTSFVYSIIAYNVFQVARDAFYFESDVNKIINFYDPTGLLKLMFRIAEMFLVKRF